MTVDFDTKPANQSRSRVRLDGTTIKSDADLIEDARREISKKAITQSVSETGSAGEVLGALNQSIAEIRNIDLKRYFADAKEFAPNTSRQALNLYLEYALHYTEKNLRNQVNPIAQFALPSEIDRINRLNARMQAIENRLNQLGIPVSGLQKLASALDNLIGPNASAPTNGTTRADLVVSQAPKLVADATRFEPLGFVSRIGEAMNRTHEILDPLKYYYGGSGSVAAPQLRNQAASHFDRSDQPLTARHGDRNSRSSKDAQLATKIDCSHYAHYQRQAVARAAGMSEDWIRKHIEYKDSRTMAREGCMSVRKALSTNQLREGDVLVYPGHAGVVGRDKNGVLCIMESTSGPNTRSGRYETGVQISDFNSWINRRIGKPSSKFVVYRDQIPTIPTL